MENTEQEKQKELQQKYLEMQMIEQKMKQVQKQLESVNNQLVEVNSTVESVGEFEKVKSDTETLTPLHNGIFFKSQLKDNSHFIVNVGAGIAVKKTPAEVKQMLGKQTDELSSVQQHLLKALESLGEQAKMAEHELSRLIK